MMLRWLHVGVFLILLSVSVVKVQAQTIWPNPEVKMLYEQAKQHHMSGNFTEAIVRYQQAIRIAPEIVLLHRELAYAYYLAGGYTDAINTLGPVIAEGKADAEAYKIMVQSLLAKKDDKKAKKVLKEALEQMPNSGPLYYEAGLLYEKENNREEALKAWLTGIEKDPGYHLNYYEAARMYMLGGQLVWAILYAETFINIEQQTPRSYDARKLMLSAYNRMFNRLATKEIPKYGSGKSSRPQSFEDAVYDTYMKLSPIMSDGVTTENLIMLRTRFVMDWMMKYADRYSFSLFSRYDEMLRRGYFDMYNQWLFGKVENESQYAAWTKFHADALPGYQNWMKLQPYRPLASDFHNSKEVDDIFSQAGNNSKR